VLEFTFLTGVLALAAGMLDEGTWWRVLLWTTTTTILLSGAQYVVLWGRKAARERRAHARAAVNHGS
jgi:hypothetical protein